MQHYIGPAMGSLYDPLDEEGHLAGAPEGGELGGAAAGCEAGPGPGAGCGRRLEEGLGLGGLCGGHVAGQRPRHLVRDMFSMKRGK